MKLHVLPAIVSSAVLLTACGTTQPTQREANQAEAAKTAFATTGAYSERELRAIKRNRLFVGMSEHSLVESLGVPHKTSCFDFLLPAYMEICKRDDIHGFIENRDGPWGRRSIYTYLLWSKYEKSKCIWNYKPDKCDAAPNSGYGYHPDATKFWHPPLDFMGTSTIHVYLENHAVVNYAHRGGGPSEPPRNYNYEFERGAWKRWPKEDRAALFQFELLKPPPEKTWYVEESQFDLIERDGLSYQVGASSPFTGSRSTYYADGAKASEIQFEMGLRHGPSTIWFDDGSVYKVMTYEIGVLRGEEVFPRE